MKDLGWSEAQHYVMDARYADGDSGVATRIAAELVATRPDVVLTTAETSILALASFTKNIPIVFANAADPVGNGYAASLQRPGGNMTGLTLLTPELAAKRVELLKELAPQTARTLVLFEPADPASLSQVKAMEAAAARLNIRLTPREIRQPADIDAAFESARTAAVDSCLIVSGPLINIQRKAIAARILGLKVPSITSNVIHTEAGVLMSYSASVPANFRRAAVFVDKILKGARPGELAIEQPTKIDLVINAKTAKALGVAIPESLRVRADRVIE